MPTRTPNAPPETSTVAFERTASGELVAIEVVTAEAWCADLLAPPALARADARVVVLRRPCAVPHPLPRWLHVERAAPHSLREASPPYGDEAGEYARLAETLWAASPHYALAVGTIEEYMQAAATALRFPAPAPTGVAAARLVRGHARTSAGVLAPMGDQAGPALERWFRRRFRHPDTLAVELLIERIDGDDPEVAGTLRLLHAAEVPLDAPTSLDLALDRRALLEQASPWRYIEAPAAFAPALAAVRAWLRRYRVGYDTEYRRVAARAAVLRRDLDAAAVAADALRRLDAIPALGEPVGALALHEFDAARAVLDAFPTDPYPTQARTAGVTLGAPVAAFDAAARAVDAIRAALEVQRRRLATRAAHLVLDRTEVPALDRLLQAITAGDIDGIERVLDDRLASHIETLLSA